MPFLEEHGFRTTFSPVMRPEEYFALYRRGGHARKALITARGLARRVLDVARSSKYDIVVVQREAVQLGTSLFERAFGRSRARLVFDFDDAVWIPNASEANRRLAWLKRAGKTAEIIAAADLVFAGNEYLRAYAEQFNPNVRVVPTTIDTSRYRPVINRPHSSKVCLGWSGSVTTLQHFDLLIPVLKRLRERFGPTLQFNVIGDAHYRNDELEIRGTAWNRSSEVQDLSEFDIGVMPLPDDEWARGKCGLKGLQYMSLGIPTVMSPVGVNCEIIQDGKNGLLAGSDSEWLDKLSRLVESTDLRRRLGRAGRETVVRKYSVESQKGRYLDYLREVLA